MSLHGSNARSLTLVSLPRDDFARILQYLEPVDLIHLAQTCSDIHSLLEDDEVWHCLCIAIWSQKTDLLRWVAAGIPASPGSKPIGLPNFKSLYKLLHHIEDLEGMWRVIGEAREGGLVRIEWRKAFMVYSRLQWSKVTHRPPQEQPCHRILPMLETIQSIEWDCDRQGVSLRIDEECIVDCERGSTNVGKQRSTEPAFRAAEAASEVGFGTPRGSPLLGESPDSSFKQAWSQFMSSSVMKPAKMRRRSLRYLTRHIHLRRVDIPQPTSKHPLAGLWICEMEDNTIEIFSLSYNFRESEAHVYGCRVSGPSASEAPWFKVKAAKVTEWSDFETDLFNKMLELRDNRNHSSTEEGSIEYSLDVLGLQDTTMVGSCHIGVSQDFSTFMQGETDDTWTSCRLYVFDDSCICLLLVDIMQILPLQRIDTNFIKPSSHSL